jgi:bifunctional DNA-binding transcriptional regulator/antitoxin component of YhaV-PrlF toxin-antitoxin module
MATIKLTSKRQATFPRELCESLGLQPGDELRLVPRVADGERVWVLQVVEMPDRPWFGRLRKYAGAAAGHSMGAIRDSIRRGRAAEKGA